MLFKSVCFRLLQFSQKKVYGDDITVGTFTFTIIHAIKSHPNDHQVSSILLLF